MADTTLRYLQILELIPREPDGISLRDLSNKLSLPNTENEIRNLQRNIETLSFAYPLLSVQKGKANYWSWKKETQPIVIPAMDTNTALVFNLAKSYLEPILPTSSVKALNRSFLKADQQLALKTNRQKHEQTHDWREKIAIFSGVIPRVPPKVNLKVQSAIHDALLNEKAIRISYRPWNSSEDKEYVVSPNGLIVRNLLTYVVVHNHADQSTRNLLMHRIKALNSDSADFIKIPQFNAQNYVDNGGLGFQIDQKNKQISLSILMDDQPLTGIQESPLSHDQVIREISEKKYALQATVDNTLELMQWLLSHSYHIEVIKPLELRDELKSISLKFNEIYNSSVIA